MPIQEKTRLNSRALQAHAEKTEAREAYSFPAKLTGKTGGTSHAGAYASALNRATASQPSRAGQSLLQLQRQYGNRYVQRVLALARKGQGEAEAAPDVEGAIQRARGGGQALDSGVRAQMEPAFGADFSGVRVHTDTEADTVSRELNARAFTTGQDVFFRQGTYNSGSSSGRELLAHELTHVVQQASGARPKLTVGQPGDRYEQEADRVARAVTQKERQSIQKDADEGLVQRQAEEEEEREEPVQAKAEEEEEEPIQPRTRDGLVKRQIEEKEPIQAEVEDGKVQQQAEAEEEKEPVQAKAENSWEQWQDGAPGLMRTTASQVQRQLAEAEKQAQIRQLAEPMTALVQRRGKRKRKVKRFRPRIRGGGIGYRRLLRDKKLEIGVGIGHPFLNEYKDLVSYLKRRKFSNLGAPLLFHYSGTFGFVPIMVPYLKEGVERWHRIKRFWLKTRKAKRKKSVDVDVTIDVMNHKSKDPKKHFAEFLSSKEIAIYSGHARYGTGPDFDSMKSVKENFIIGVNSALHKTGKLTRGYKPKVNKALEKRANDLEAMSKAGRFNPKLYQVWFFNACKTIHYLDEIRGGLVKEKSRANLRVVGTRRDISISRDAIPFIDGILKQQSMNKILKRLNKLEGKGTYFSD